MPLEAGSPAAPWVIATHLAQAMAGLGRDALGLAQAMRIFDPNPGTNPAFVQQMLQRMMPAFAPGGSGLLSNCLNLKQFRLSDNPSLLCYQALTNGPFQVTEFHGGGLLGEGPMLLGDVSGGYTIKLFAYPTVSIAETLGLEVHGRSSGPGVDVLSLKPVLPFWYNVNMTYLPGVNLAWRTDDGIWRGASGKPLPSTRSTGPSADPPLFNSTVGSAIDEVSGPFRFDGTTIRVLPLLASRERLTEFLDTYINSAITESGDPRVRLSVWARPQVNITNATAAVGTNPAIPDTPEIVLGGESAHVYMTVSTFSSVTSRTNNVGDWIEAELAFLIPVKWERRSEDGEWELEGVGLVPAYTFVKEVVAAIARVEVLGIPTLCATFAQPKSAWMAAGVPTLDSKQHLLRVDAEVVPALGEGQQAATHPLVEISTDDYEAGVAELASRDIPRAWADLLVSELRTKKATKAQFPLECKIARALALELLGNQAPVSLYTLKQFRDVVDPNKACYQSLVRLPKQFDEIFDVREIEETIRVRIRDFPSLSIAESLGIVATKINEGTHEAGIIYATQAIRPFYIRATVSEGLGERLANRAGPLPMEFAELSTRSLLSDKGPKLIVDGEAETVQDQGDPCWMNAVMRQAAARRRLAGDSNITKEAARIALETVDPQMVIESMLSREWGNLDEHARWRRGRRQIASAIVAPTGGDANAETALYSGVPLGAIPAQNIQPLVEQMIASATNFAVLKSQMEGPFTSLTNWAVSQGLQGRQTSYAYGGPPPIPLLQCLIQSIGSICNAQMVGDPAPLKNLEPPADLNNQVQGDYFRLRTDCHSLFKTFGDRDHPSDGVRTGDLAIRDYWAQIKSAVQLARTICDVQREALLNKLARTYQKPDFCVKRDSVGPDGGSLLPASLSWDEDWFEDTSLGKRLIPRDPSAVLACFADREFTIVASEDTYAPSQLDVKEGDWVKVTLRSKDAAYSFVIDEYFVYQLVDAGDTAAFAFRADREGTFTFYSDRDPSQAEMKGTFTVKTR